MGFRASLSSGRLTDPPAPTPAADLSALVSSIPGASWWDKEPAYVHLTGGAADTWTDRVRGITVTDGGSAARRPSYDANTGLTFNGTTNYLSGAVDILKNKSKSTLIVFGTATTPATYGSMISYGAGGVFEELLYDFADGPTTLFSAVIVDGAHTNVACSGIAPTTQQVWTGTFDWGVASPTRALYRNGGGQLINNRALNPSVVGTPPSGTLFMGCRPTATFIQAMTITDVIVVPDELTQVQIAQWSALLRQYRGLSQYLLSSQVSDSAVATPGRLGFDIVSEYAIWEGGSTLRPGDVIHVVTYTDVGAGGGGIPSFGVQEGSSPITSLGVTDFAPVDGTFVARSHAYTIQTSRPRLRLIGGAQGYLSSAPNHGTYIAEILLPSGRVYTPTSQTATRRLLALVDSIGTGQTSSDFMLVGLAAYLRANYPGRVTFLGSGSYGYAAAATDAGLDFSAAGTAAGALCTGTVTNEVLAQMGTNDWVLYAAQYLDASDFRTKLSLFWSSFAASAPPGTAYFLQTIGPRTFGVPSSLGTVAQCRTAEIGAFSDISLSATIIDGATVYTLAASPDNLHPAVAQQVLYGPIERAGMGTW